MSQIISKNSSFMKKLIIALCVTVATFFATEVAAQTYNSAIGLRLGYPTSLSYKTFLSEKAAFEGILGFRSNSVGWRWIAIGAAYQVHNPINGVAGLQWYYGGGASLYLWSFDDDVFFEDESNVSFGIQGYLGLDFKIPNAPINLSLDWVPTFFIGGYGSGFGADYGSLSVRYTLK